jgi:hypothetical protein
MMRIALPTLLLTMLALPSRRAAAEELTPPPGFRDRSGLTELVFWQG